jgi:hypothetical protein
LTWFWPEEKRQQTLNLLKKFFEKPVITLEDFQKLHGKLNSFSQMQVFLKAFRFNQSRFLRDFANQDKKWLPTPDNLKQELKVWAKVLLSANKPQPIPNLRKNPNLYAKKFISDAAGSQFLSTTKCGVASVGFDESSFWFATRIFWNSRFLQSAASNMSFLEAIGLLLPFVTVPKKLCGREIVLYVDNLAVVYAWDKRYSKNDEKTSIVIQALHLIEVVLPCRIFVEHEPRRSSYQAKLADNLTRVATTDQPTWDAVKNVWHHQMRSPIAVLIKTCEITWDFPLQIADFVNHLIRDNQ